MNAVISLVPALLFLVAPFAWSQESCSEVGTLPGYDTTPLIEEVRKGNEEGVGLLIEQGADLNEAPLTGKYQKTALLVAIERCEVTIALRLIKAGGYRNAYYFESVFEAGIRGLKEVESALVNAPRHSGNSQAQRDSDL